MGAACGMLLVAGCPWGSRTVRVCDVSYHRDGAGSQARFGDISDMIFEADGNLLVGDTTFGGLRRITVEGQVTTLATPSPSLHSPCWGTRGELLVLARNLVMAWQEGATASVRAGGRYPHAFYSPQGLAALPEGKLLVADSGNNLLKVVTPEGLVESSPPGAEVPVSVGPGFVDGPLGYAQFRGPSSMVAEASGTVYFLDGGRIRRFSPTLEVTTIGGDASSESRDGAAAQAGLGHPWDLALGRDGTLWFIDRKINRVRQLSVSGEVSTLPPSGPPSAQVTSLCTDAQGRLFASLNAREGDARGGQIVAWSPGGTWQVMAGGFEACTWRERPGQTGDWLLGAR